MHGGEGFVPDVSTPGADFRCGGFRKPGSRHPLRENQPLAAWSQQAADHALPGEVRGRGVRGRLKFQNPRGGEAKPLRSLRLAGQGPPLYGPETGGLRFARSGVLRMSVACVMDRGLGINLTKKIRPL